MSLPDHAVGDGLRQSGQDIPVFAGAGQFTVHHFPTEFHGCTGSSGGDLNITCNGFDMDLTVSVSRRRDIRAAHGDGDIHTGAAVCGQRCLIGAALHGSCRFIIRIHIGVCAGNVIELDFSAQHSTDDGLTHQIHAGCVGMGALITDVQVKKLRFLGDAALPIDHGAAEMLCNRNQLCIECRGLTGIGSVVFRIIGVPSCESGHTVNFRIRITGFDLMKHDGIGFTGGRGRNIGKGAVAVILDQRRIIHICRLAKGILIVGKVIGTQVYPDDVRLFAGAVIVKVHRSAAVADRGFPLSGLENTGTAPGIVDQKFHTKHIKDLLPPHILLIHTVPAFRVIHIIVPDGGIGRSIVGYTDIGRCTGAEDGNGFTAPGALRCFFSPCCRRQHAAEHHKHQKRRYCFFHDHPSFSNKSCSTVVS